MLSTTEQVAYDDRQITPEP